MLNAKTLSVVCVLIALTSGYFGQQFHEKAASSTRQAQAARADADKARQAFDELSSVLTPDKETLSLEKATGGTLLDVYNSQVAFGVSVAAVTPGRPAAAAVSDVVTLSEKVPTTAIDSLKLNVVGSYTSYEGLLGYVQKLQAGQAALTRLKVADKTFELSLRVYGTS